MAGYNRPAPGHALLSLVPFPSCPNSLGRFPFPILLSPWRSERMEGFLGTRLMGQRMCAGTQPRRLVGSDSSLEYVANWGSDLVFCCEGSGTRPDVKRQDLTPAFGPSGRCPQLLRSEFRTVSPELQRGNLLGTDSFIEEIAPFLNEQLTAIEIPRHQRLAAPLTPETLFEDVP